MSGFHEWGKSIAEQVDARNKAPQPKILAVRRTQPQPMADTSSYHEAFADQFC